MIDAFGSSLPWIALILTGLIATVWLGYRLSRRRRFKRPDWSRMMADTQYFRKAMQSIFKAQGYVVRGYSVMKDPTEREPREIVFALRKRGKVYCAFCVRWVVPVTSDVIDRFETALRNTQAQRGLIITTSIYTPAALTRANGLPVDLFDREQVQKWIKTIWSG